MKNPSATTTVIVAVILLCAVSTGGQQGTENGTVLKKNQPGFIPATRRIAYLPDGRIVAFPISTSEEEIDAVARHITEGAVELPPMAKVIGWEPVEGATSLLPRYAERVATIPTTKGKLDALANAASILQPQIDLMKADIQYAHARIAIEEKSSDHLAKILDENTGALAYRLDDLKQEADKLKRELDDFKDAACPIVRTANVGSNARMKLDSACGLH